MNEILNPILRGFNPDPSIIRVGDDYYLATSTFEWFPGVQIHHSKDLVHWKLLTHPLQRTSQLDMLGNVSSGGVWAPCLTFDKGIFYLIYTDVKSRKGAFKDTHNYLVTATDILGPWSDPVYLNSSGFDPSLFHDEDGRKWLLNMIWDFRKGRNKFGGIVIQEYSIDENKLIGPVSTIFQGTELGFTEGPHIYKRNGFYYLMTAEGGTKYEHAVTMARSTSLLGPYEIDPHNPMLTSFGAADSILQKAGHGDLVETQNGEWYLAHLCARPTVEHFCTLGRETALQKCVWDDSGWLRLAGGGNGPLLQAKAPQLPSFPFPPEAEKDDFDEAKLGLHWSTLRIPPDPSWFSLEEREGHLRLRGMESLSSWHRQSLVARRQQSFQFEAETQLEFNPVHFQQMAGLILYYDGDDYVYLRISHEEVAGKVLGIIQTIQGQYDEFLDAEVSIPEHTPIRLKANVNREKLQFSYALGEADWERIGPEIDIRHLSDDAAFQLRFTGTFVGMCVQDLSGTRLHADFDYFVYKERHKL